MVWTAIQLPKMEEIDLTDKKQVRRLYSYLYKLDEQLRFNLSNIDEENLGTGLTALINSKVSGADVESLIRQSAGEIMLIVKKPASALDTGNGILINENGIYMTAGVIDLRTIEGGQYLIIKPDGVDASIITSPVVSPRYAGAAVLTVNPDATEEQMAIGNVYRSLADALAQLTGQQLGDKVKIVCVQGAVFYGDLTLSGVCGGEIEIAGADSTLYGSLTLDGCSSRLMIDRLNVVSAGAEALSVKTCAYVEMRSCSLSSVQSSAAAVEQGSRVYGEECTLIGGGESAVTVSGLSEAAFVDCIGTGTIGAQFSQLTAVGKVPDGGCADWGGAVVNDEDTVPTGADGTPVVPQVYTVSYAMVHTDSFAGGGWSYFDDEDPRQGMYNNKVISGCIWFDNALLRGDLAGKTVKQASLRLFARKGFGRGVKVDVELSGTTREYENRAEIGRPDVAASYGLLGKAQPGEVTEFTIPVQAAADLAAGTINALMLYSSDTTSYEGRAYSRNYACFAGETTGTVDTIPVLTVTYE